MLTISTKSQYGLKAVLALAKNDGQGLLQIKEIARIKKIPRQYLEQILNQLGKAKIVRSVRGKNGGYELARHPHEIMVSEIITLLEGGIEFAPAHDNLDVTIIDLFRFAENRLLEAFNVSLEELVDRQQKIQDVITYDI